MRSVVITGAVGGIGSALCKGFKTAGYQVIATDRTTGEVAADAFVTIDLARFCRDEAYRAVSLAQVRAVVRDDCLHALVNNAAAQVVKPVPALTVVDWNLTLDVNLLAPFLLTQQLLDLLEAGQGSVVNIASIHAQLTKPEFVCYATSKAALVGMTRAMAVELGSRVRVNAICPAAVATPMLVAGFDGHETALSQLGAVHPVGRIGEPVEVARAALFLASSDSNFLNGAILGLDGGIASRLHDPV